MFETYFQIGFPLSLLICTGAAEKRGFIKTTIINSNTVLGKHSV
jgi:hypothetical protein